MLPAQLNGVINTHYHSDHVVFNSSMKYPLPHIFGKVKW
ncbi:hypothetical protein [Lysinibacillus fusiformis]